MAGVGEAVSPPGEGSRDSGGSAQEGGGGELGEAGPTGHVEGRLGMLDEGVLLVVIAERLLDLGEGCLLLCAGGTLPIKAKAFATDGAENVGRIIGKFAKCLHSVFLVNLWIELHVAVTDGGDRFSAGPGVRVRSGPVRFEFVRVLAGMSLLYGMRWTGEKLVQRNQSKYA